MEGSLNKTLSGSSIVEDFEIIHNHSKNTNINKPVLENGYNNLEDILCEAIKETASNKSSDSTTEEVIIASNVPAGLDLLELINESDIPHSLRIKQMDFENNTTAQIDNSHNERESCRLVGAGSKFYSMIDNAETHPLEPEILLTPPEKQDVMKPSDSDDEVSDVDQECTMFSGVCYLGAAAINTPKSEAEIQRIMGTLCSQRESETGIAVSVSIPVCSQGMVVLYDAETNSVWARYTVKRISFYARGAVGTPVASCFAFTWSHGDTKESAVYQCHVFRCHIAEAVTQVSSCFAKAFERVPRSMNSSIVGELTSIPSMTSSIEGSASLAPPMQLMHILECTVDIKEMDVKGCYSQVPKERVGFKIRGGIDKEVSITVKQVSNSIQTNEDSQDICAGRLFIDRCFGILLAPGRNVKHSDMRLLEMVSGASDECMGYSAHAVWNAGDQALAAFNVASSDGSPNYMSIGLDLVIRGIPDPLRLVIETPVKVYPPTERFWYYSKRPLVQQFFINLKEGTDKQGNIQYSVSGVETNGELDRSRLLPLSLASLLPSPLAPPPPASPGFYDSPTEESDNDEPLLSGTGEVSKDCSISVLDSWSQVLRGWKGARPSSLNHLVKLGVPEPLRCEVWQRLVDIDSYQHLMDQYKILILKDCPCESEIHKDIARTFPAHHYFAEAGGLGQDSLLRVTRAYAVYDAEVGYYQGFSFLVATLLLHMPEEQAFCVFVCLMYKYKLREMYKDRFEALYMRLHILDRLMEEQLGDLRQHFQKNGVETHMFAQQWFLTIFTVRFPLPFVFHIVDVFLLQGMDTLFQVALALLSMARKDLLQLDFEGILKYIRVTLPKRCRSEEVAQKIIKNACSIKLKRLPKYQMEFEEITREATEKEKLNAELERLKSLNLQLKEDKKQLETQLSEAWNATKSAVKESQRSALVAKEYRDICSRLENELHQIKDVTKQCSTCCSKLQLNENKTECKQNKDGKSEEIDSEMRRRVRELELELAQVKLEHAQAQCNNQELSHKLNITINEYQTMINQKQSWPPWLSRTLGSIKEVAQNSRPSFQTYLPNINLNADNINQFDDTSVELRRDSVPYSPRNYSKETKRHSMADMPRRGSSTEKETNRRSHDFTSMKNFSLG